LVMQGAKLQGALLALLEENPGLGNPGNSGKAMHLAHAYTDHIMAMCGVLTGENHIFCNVVDGFWVGVGVGWVGEGRFHLS